MSVQKALKDSMSELSKEVHLAASCGELSESLQQRIELVMRFFLALGEEVDETVASAETRRETVETIPEAHDAYMPVDNENIFGMARG